MGLSNVEPRATDDEVRSLERYFRRSGLPSISERADPEYRDRVQRIGVIVGVAVTLLSLIVGIAGVPYRDFIKGTLEKPIAVLVALNIGTLLFVHHETSRDRVNRSAFGTVGLGVGVLGALMGLWAAFGVSRDPVDMLFPAAISALLIVALSRTGLTIILILLFTVRALLGGTRDTVQLASAFHEALVGPVVGAPEGRCGAGRPPRLGWGPAWSLLLRTVGWSPVASGA